MSIKPELVRADFTAGAVKHGNKSLASLEGDHWMEPRVYESLDGSTRAAALEICGANRSRKRRNDGRYRHSPP